MTKAEILGKWKQIFREARSNQGIDYTAKIAELFDDHVVSLETVSLGEKKFLVGENIFQVKDDEGNSLIHQAAKMKNVPLICYLISQGVDPNLRNKEGKTYLELDEMQELLRSSKRVVSKVESDIAKASTLPPQIKSIYNCSDVEFSEVSKAFLRRISRDERNVSITQTRINLDNIDQSVGEDGETLLHVAALNGQASLVKGLIRRGADCSKTTVTGITPLMSGCMSGSSAVVKSLLLKHVNVNDRALDGNTALHAAVVSGKDNIAKLLLKHPLIDVSIRNERRETAADLCENHDIKALIQAKEVRPLVIQAAAPRVEALSVGALRVEEPSRLITKRSFLESSNSDSDARTSPDTTSSQSGEDSPRKHGVFKKLAHSKSIER